MPSKFFRDKSPNGNSCNFLMPLVCNLLLMPAHSEIQSETPENFFFQFLTVMIFSKISKYRNFNDP